LGGREDNFFHFRFSIILSPFGREADGNCIMQFLSEKRDTILIL